MEYAAAILGFSAHFDLKWPPKDLKTASEMVASKSLFAQSPDFNVYTKKSIRVFRIFPNAGLRVPWSGRLAGWVRNGRLLSPLELCWETGKRRPPPVVHSTVLQRWPNCKMLLDDDDETEREIKRWNFLNLL